MGFGERLRNLRKDHKMTQQELADKLQLTQNAIWGYESGRRTPSYDRLVQIADIFDVSLDYLLCRTDTPAAPQTKSRDFDPGAEDWLEKSPVWVKMLYQDPDCRQYLEQENVREVVLDPRNKHLFNPENLQEKDWSARRKFVLDVLTFIAWRFSQENRKR